MLWLALVFPPALPMHSVVTRLSTTGGFFRMPCCFFVRESPDMFRESLDGTYFPTQRVPEDGNADSESINSVVSQGWDAQVAKLALGSILEDTSNLKSESKTTCVDREVSLFGALSTHRIMFLELLLQRYDL